MHGSIICLKIRKGYKYHLTPVKFRLKLLEVQSVRGIKGKRALGKSPDNG